jgi:hypothetical protein
MSFGKFKEKNDRTQVEEAYNKLLARQDELTLGEEGFSNIRGGDAVKNNGEFREKYSKSWQSSYNEISSGLSTEQQEAFKLRAMAARRQYDSNMMKHFGTETVNYQKDTFKASLENIQNQASINYHRPEVVAATRARAGALANDMADTLGYGPETEVYKDFMRDQLTKVHASVISGALEAEDVQYAREYIEANKDEINEDVEAQLLKKVKTYGVKEEAYSIVDNKIAGKYSSFEQARRAGVFTSIDNPDVREKVEAKARQHFNDLKASENAADEAKVEFYQNRALVLERGTDENGNKTSYADMFATGDLDRLTASQRSTLAKIDENRRTGTTPKTTQEGWRHYTRIMSLPPEEQAKEDILSLRPILGDTEYKKLVGEVSEAKNPDDPKYARSRTLSSKAKVAFESHYGKNKYSTANGLMFSRKLDQRLQQAEMAKGKDLSPDEEDKIINTLMTDVVLQRKDYWFDKTGKLWELDEAFTVENIPDDIREQIISNYERANKDPEGNALTPSNAQIKAAFLAMAQAGRI